MTHPIAYIAYGEGRVPLELDPALADWRVVSPRMEAPHEEPHAAFIAACRHPVGSPPLRDVIRPHDRVVISTADGTRPVPNRLLIPWLLEELPVPTEQVTVVLGTGTHRPNTPEEIDAIFGPDVAKTVRIVNHDAYDPARNITVGRTADGVEVRLGRDYVEADKRIALGFIEPHFFAGFSGGPKAVAPGVASLETILHLHRYELIAHPDSVWGVLEENPLHRTIREIVALCPPEFLVNVTLNSDKAVTRVFAGHYLEAHRLGCAYVREQAMAPVERSFPIVVTSNSGHPLDQNLYQSVKGLSAAARIAQEGGSIVMASACRDGIPAHGRFRQILAAHDTIEEVDAYLRSRATPELDQWQVQVLVQVRKRCAVDIYSMLPTEDVVACKLNPVADLAQAVRARIEEVGKGAPVAVLPDGPITISYIE